MTKLFAGIAKTDITTNVHESMIHDPLYAKVLVLDNGHATVVVIAMDVTAIGGRTVSQRMLDDIADDFLPELRNRIQKKLKIPGSNVLVNASHTHPPGILLCEDAEQIDRTFDAVKRALQNKVPVTVGFGKGYEDRITMNRTLRLKNGKHWTVRHTNPCPPDKDVADVGPCDPEIGIMKVDRIDGKPLAVVYNFACHLLFGDTAGKITANFPAVASKIVEEYLGNDTMALFLQGAAGDVVDVCFKDFSRPREIESFGTMLGLSIVNTCKTIESREDVELAVISENIELPRRADIPERIDVLRLEQNELIKSLRFTTLNFKVFLPMFIQYSLNPDYPLDYAYRYFQSQKTGHEDFSAMDSFNRKNIEKYLKNISAMEKLTRIQDDIATLEKHQAINDQSGEQTITAEVQGIKIGDCILVTSPAELLVEIGMNIKKSSPYKHTFIAAYSNGYLHYGCPTSYYDKGGYEVTECLLAPHWQQIYENKINEIFRRLK